MYLRINKKSDNQNNPKKKKITILVVSGHILLILCIFMLFSFKGCTDKKKMTTVSVSIVSNAQPQQALQQTSQTKSIKKRPIKKTPKKKTYKATKPKKKAIPKKKWKALDPSQIKKSSSTIIRKRAPAKVKPIRSSDIAGSLRSQIKRVKFSNSYSADKLIKSHDDQVMEYLYSRWEQPLAGMQYDIPTVIIIVSIDGSGKVLDYSIVEKSNIVSMDSSVEQLLSNLTSLPPHPDGAQDIEIVLKLTNSN